MSDERMRKIDAHLERGEELMQLNRAAFDHNTEAFERNRQAFDRNAEAFDRNAEAFDRNIAAFEHHERATDRMLDEHGELLREITLRSERVTQQLVESVRESMGKTDVVIEELRDLRAESRAQLESLFRILDRLGPPEAPA